MKKIQKIDSFTSTFSTLSQKVNEIIDKMEKSSHLCEACNANPEQWSFIDFFLRENISWFIRLFLNICLVLISMYLLKYFWIAEIQILF